MQPLPLNPEPTVEELLARGLHKLRWAGIEGQAVLIYPGESAAVVAHVEALERPDA